MEIACRLTGCTLSRLVLLTLAYSSSFQFQGRDYNPPTGRSLASHWKTWNAHRLEAFVSAGSEPYRSGDKGIPLSATRGSSMTIRCSPLDAQRSGSIPLQIGREQIVRCADRYEVLVQRCILMVPPTRGTSYSIPPAALGTTAHVAEHWGRRWITVDTSRVALALSPRPYHGCTLSHTICWLRQSRRVSSKEAESR